jgi:hypothetical protein
MNPNQKIIESLSNLNLPAGVDIEIKNSSLLGRDLVWLVVEKPDGFFLSFKLFAWMDKHQHQAVCIRHTWAGNILDEAARYGRIKNIAIVRNAESREEAQVIVYRLSKTLLSFEDACREAM